MNTKFINNGLTIPPREARKKYNLSLEWIYVPHPT